MCNTQECKKYLRHSVCRHTHEANAILTILGHELLFILLDFMIQNDYGFRGCTNILTRLWIHLHNNMLWGCHFEAREALLCAFTYALAFYSDTVDSSNIALFMFCCKTRTVTTNKVPFLMNRHILDARLTKVQEYKIYVCIHSGNDVITITISPCPQFTTRTLQVVPVLRCHTQSHHHPMYLGTATVQVAIVTLVLHFYCNSWSHSHWT